jgi:hypothetical protein
MKMVDESGPLHVKNTFVHLEELEEMNNAFAMMRQQTAPARSFQRQLSSTPWPYEAEPRRVSFANDDISPMDYTCLKEPEAEPAGTSPVDALHRQVSERIEEVLGRQISCREDLEEFCRQLSGLSEGSFNRQETEQAWPTWDAIKKPVVPAVLTEQDGHYDGGDNWQDITSMPQLPWNPTLAMPPWPLLPGFSAAGLAPIALGSEQPKKNLSKRKGKSVITLAREAQLQQQQSQGQTLSHQNKLGQVFHKNEPVGKAGQKEEGAKFCPYCGKKIQPTFKFCRFCGNSVAAVFKSK